MPFKIAFINDDTIVAIIWDYFQDAFFLCDIFIVFISSYPDPITFQPVMDQKVIAVNYLKGWFAIDLISSFPFGAIISAMPSLDINDNLLRINRLPRLYRLVRIARLMKIIRVFKKTPFFLNLIDTFSINPGSIRMVKIVGFVIFLIHLMSCLWFLSSTL
jgi:hypothetical protein